MKSTAKGPTIGPDLAPVFHGASPAIDETMRKVIEQGFPHQMPGFRYALKPSEIDEIIQYLNTL